ncbi:MAG: YciI family protein [Acidobacteriota bacterium]
MTRPTDETLLAFLDGSMGEAERNELLDALDGDPQLSERLRAAAAGLEAMRTLAAGERGAGDAPASAPRRVSRWWVAVAAAATLVLAVPVTWWTARATVESGPAAMATGQPVGSQPSYVLVLHGTWPDGATITPEERQRRAAEYWGWTTELAEEGILMAAGDLRWEPGERLGPTGTPIPVSNDEVEAPQYLVGMLAVRAASYEDAVALAEQCPHLRYGGRVSVRRVGSGFVTVPGMGDW